MSEVGTDDRELWVDVGACVRALVPLLAPRHSEILALVELGGASLPDAARALDLPVAEARDRLRDGRSALQMLLALACASCPHPGCVSCGCEGCAARSGGRRGCG